MRELQGLPASQGVAIGPAVHFRSVELEFERTTVDDPDAEWARFETAVEKARAELAQVHARARETSDEDEAAIFKAHAMMLEDPELLDAVHSAIREQRINAEAALSDASERFAQQLEALEDEYLRARAADVRDVARRVLRVLLGKGVSPTTDMTTPSILLAYELSPSDTVSLDKSLVLGFCTAVGGVTSHTAILASALGIPAVVGAGPDVLEIDDGTLLILDGLSGALLVEPDESTVADYERRSTALEDRLSAAREQADEPAVTRDGHRVEVVANIRNAAAAQSALQAGAEGVGLLRTEFLYLERQQLPTEEEQYEVYRQILDTFGDRPVILRTLDVGGDKDLPYVDLPEELNPFLGLRGIRLCLARPELFRPQLRAALRAGVDRNLKLMFPMVATLDELRAARAVLDECRTELRVEGTPAAEHVEVGIMVEVPAAAIMIDHFAAEVDFVSVGTNDLSQYTMAADRTAPHVAHLSNACQPAVLRLLRDVIDGAHRHGKWAGVCGELAGEPLAIPILLGLGLDEFSMSAPAIPLAKQIIRELTLDEVKEVAQAALDLESPEAIHAFVRERVPAADLGIERC